MFARAGRTLAIHGESFVAYLASWQAAAGGPAIMSSALQKAPSDRCGHGSKKRQNVFVAVSPVTATAHSIGRELSGPAPSSDRTEVDPEEVSNLLAGHERFSLPFPVGFLADHCSRLLSYDFGLSTRDRRQPLASDIAPPNCKSCRESSPLNDKTPRWKPYDSLVPSG